MIEIKNVSKSFGGIKAVKNVTLNINKGSITGLIGPNGAEKLLYLILLLVFTMQTLEKLFLKEKIYFWAEIRRTVSKKVFFVLSDCT